MYDNGDIFFTEDHAWNTFKMDGKWYLSDLTWASGYLQVKYSWFYYYTWRLKLRKMPFKFKYKKNYDPFFLYNNGVKFSILHFPMAPDYQLLKEPRSIHDFENQFLFIDSLKRYYDENISNAQIACDQCENDPSRDPIELDLEISKQHLNDNPRNTFSYLKNFVAHDAINAEDVGVDTFKIKDEIKRYEGMMPYTICSFENVNLDHKVNKWQNSNKNRIFRNEYFNRYKSALMRKMLFMQKGFTVCFQFFNVIVITTMLMNLVAPEIHLLNKGFVIIINY